MGDEVVPWSVLRPGNAEKPPIPLLQVQPMGAWCVTS